MNATPRSFSAVSTVSSSQVKHGDISVKSFAQSGFDHETAYRMWFRDMLWRAFPAPSDRDRAAKAAKVLDVSERQVRNWLRCDNNPTLPNVMKVIAIAGAEVVFRKVEGDQ